MCENNRPEDMMGGSTYLPAPTPSSISWETLLAANDGNLPFSKETLLKYPPRFLDMLQPTVIPTYHRQYEGWCVVDNSGPIFDAKTHRLILHIVKHHPTVLQQGAETAAHFMRADPYLKGGFGAATKRCAFDKQSADQYVNQFFIYCILFINCLIYNYFG
jgi:hypothetical protein